MSKKYIHNQCNYVYIFMHICEKSTYRINGSTAIPRGEVPRPVFKNTSLLLEVILYTSICPSSVLVQYTISDIQSTVSEESVLPVDKMTGLPLQLMPLLFSCNAIMLIAV